MLQKRRIISHIILWAFIGAGIFLAFNSIDAGIVFKKAFNRWIAIIPLWIFFLYHISSSFYYCLRFYPLGGAEKKIIQAGVYGRCAHPTCTALVILGWIFFFYVPDFRVLASAAWATAMVFFWIRIEKSFFSGRRSRLDRERPEPA